MHGMEELPTNNPDITVLLMESDLTPEQRAEAQRYAEVMVHSRVMEEARRVARLVAEQVCLHSPEFDVCFDGKPVEARMAGQVRNQFHQTVASCLLAEFLYENFQHSGFGQEELRQRVMALAHNVQAITVGLITGEPLG